MIDRIEVVPDVAFGDRGPAGGWIFYDKGDRSDGWRYLEAAPKNLDKRMNWEDAISAVRKYTAEGYSDWRLPTKEELNWMYENLHQEGVGGFAPNYHWSSTENSSITAWVQSFGSGSQYGRYAKTYDSRVRAVRAF